MKIYLGSDHAGFSLKNLIKQDLEGMGLGVEDLGPNSEESVDYPDYAKAVAEKVAGEEGSLGVLVCGTGIGMSMAANKVRGIRAALCSSVEAAKLTREHNNANIVCIGARMIEEKTAREIVKAFIETPFSKEERHRRRVDKIEG